MGSSEVLPRSVVPGVEQGSIGQDDSYRFQNTIAVCMNTTIHTRSVVHHDASHHGRFLRSRIRGEDSLIGTQYFIHPLTNDTRLQRNGRSIGSDAVVFPILSGHDEHRISHSLSRETRTGSPKRNGHLIALRQLHQSDNVFFRARTNHDFRKQAVKTGVCSPRKAM